MNENVQFLSVSAQDSLTRIEEKLQALKEESRTVSIQSVSVQPNSPKGQTVENQYQREKRADEFLRNIKKPRINIPDPDSDFHTYEKMSNAMDGLHDHLERLRRNYGTVGYCSQNLMSDLQKAYIDEVQDNHSGDEFNEELAFLDHGMEQLARGLNEASADGEIAEVGNRFTRTVWQERLEADLFGKLWPVIIGRTNEIPNLISWRDFQGNVQAFLYGYLDLVSELAKAVGKELSKLSLDSEDIEREFELFRRYLSVAESLMLRLSQERHVPGYIISNGYGRFMAYTNKVRTAYGAIAHVRYDYNLRLSNERMRRSMMEMMKRIEGLLTK